MTTNPIVEALRSTTTRARVTSSALGLSRTDKQATKDVTASSGAVSGAARVVVSRLAGADEHHKAIVAAQANARKVLFSMSMPYGDEEGWRILPNANFERFVREFGQAKRAYQAAYDQLAANADEVLEAVRTNKGTLSIDVPTKDELLAAYSLDFSLEDYPVGNFTGLPDAVATKLSSRMQTRMEQAVEQAALDTLSRFVGPLEHFVDRMKAFSKREQEIANGAEPTKHGIFRDTVVTNIKHLYDVLGAFNIAGDERLLDLKNSLASLAEVDPDTLRDNIQVRDAGVDRASQVLANLNSWLRPPTQQAA
jgi:hypothetical protein